MYLSFSVASTLRVLVSSIVLVRQGKRTVAVYEIARGKSRLVTR